MNVNPDLIPELNEFVSWGCNPLSSTTEGYLDSIMSPPTVNDITSSWLTNDSGYDSSMSPFANNSSFGAPWIEITNQPQDLFRFRYLKESKKPHGPLQGANGVSKSPQVRLHNFNGEAIVRCWLTEPDSNRPSPHQLVGRDQNGQITYEPHDIIVNSFNNYTANFEKLNIIHSVFSEKDYFHYYIKKYNHITSGLYAPPQAEYVHISMSDFKNTSKNLASLYFEIFAFENGQYVKIADAKSNQIRNKKSPETSDLRIQRVSSIKGSCKGGDEVFLFVDKIVKDVKIKFYEEDCDGNVVWSDYAHFGPNDIHHQVAIAMKTPQYKDLKITEEVRVFFKLEKENKNIYVESPPRQFSYTPIESSLPPFSDVKRKRKMHSSSSLPTVIDEHRRDTFAEILNELNLKIDSAAFSRTQHNLFRLLHDSIVENNEIMFENIFFKCVQAGIDLDERNSYNETLLQIAVQRGNNIFVEKLLQAGSSVETQDKDFNTVLHLAVIHFPECLNLLIRKCSSKIQKKCNRDGDNLLLLGARLGSKIAVNTLLENGWDLEFQNLKTGDTALHLATQCNHIGMIELLLQNGAEANFENYAGRTPFHYAASCGNINILKILFATGIKLPNEKQNLDNCEILCGPNIFEVADVETTKFLKEYSESPPMPKNTTLEKISNVQEKTEILPLIDSNLEVACKLATEMKGKCLLPVLKSVSPRSTTKLSQIIIEYFQDKVADPVAHIEEHFSKLNI